MYIEYLDFMGMVHLLLITEVFAFLYIHGSKICMQKVSVVLYNFFVND